MAFQYNGLTSDKVEKSREKHGSNAITRQEKTTFWDKLSENLKDPMIIILIVALGIVTVLAAGGYAKWYEGIGIAVAVILATIVSTAAEYKNEKTFQKLQEEASRIKINVFRDGSIRQVDIDDIVVGDIILLQAGDKIPSDGWIIDGSLKINQAMFTGEAAAVYKNAADEPNPEPELSDGWSVFRGTTVEDGEGVMQVETVGDKTRFGELSFQLATEERKGPLRIKLANLAKGIAKFAYIGAIFIALSFVFKVVFLDNQFQTAQIMAYLSDWHKVLYDAAMAAILAVIIIVVAVPEGLPMMIAIVLAQNMKKLLNAKVLVRQLMGIETSGSLNILFCDKTGTITRGELQAVDFFMVSKYFDSGSQDSTNPDYVDFDNIPDAIRKLLDMALRETSSTVINPDAENEKEKLVGGNATERTLLKFIGADTRKPVYDPDSVELIQQITFNTDRKFSASRINRKNEKKLTLVKGAPEKVLEASESYYDQNGDTHRFDSDLKNKVFDKLEESSQKGYRMMAIATGDVELENDEIYELPSGLSILGFISIRD